MRPYLQLLAMAACTAVHGGMYLQIPTIFGESVDAGHKRWIDVLSYSTGVSRPSGDLTLSPFFGDLALQKRVDAATPRLMLAAAEGRILKDLVFVVTRGGAAYSEYRMRDAIVTGISPGGASGSDELIESVSLNYSKLDWLYRQLGPDGTVHWEGSAYWDIPVSIGGFSVGAGNFPPSIQPIAAQTVAPGESRTVTVIIGDTETPAAELGLEAWADRPELITDITLGGSGASRTLSFRVSPLFSGSGNITVEVSDGNSMRSVAFAVLTGVTMTPFESFMRAYFDPAELLDRELSSPIADPDGDDMATLFEYAVGTNPREFTLPQEAVRISRENTPAGPVIRLFFNRRADDPGIRIVPWMAPGSLLFQPLRAGNPIYEEKPSAGTNPLYEKVEAVIQVETGPVEAHLIRLQVEFN